MPKDAKGHGSNARGTVSVKAPKVAKPLKAPKAMKAPKTAEPERTSVWDRMSAAKKASFRMKDASDPARTTYSRNRDLQRKGR